MISLKLEIYLYDRITPMHVIPQIDFMILILLRLLYSIKIFVC